MTSMTQALDPRGAAIRTALESLLDNKQLYEAMQLWQEKYAGQKTFSVQYFVRECCALLNVKTLRNQMIQNLVTELNSQRIQHADKKSVVDKGQETQNVDAVQVFQLLFNELISRAGSLRGWELTSYVVAALPKMQLQDDARYALGNWLNHQAAIGNVFVPAKAMTVLLNQAYIGLCEYCGPVKADQILHEAVTIVAATKAGQLFHPEKLL